MHVVYNDAQRRKAFGVVGVSAVVSRGTLTSPEKVKVQRRAAGLVCSSDHAGCMR